MLLTRFFPSCRFCDRHGPNAAVNKPVAPTDLMCVAEAMMPRIILRLIQHLRENWYVEHYVPAKVIIFLNDEFVAESRSLLYFKHLNYLNVKELYLI